VISWFLGLSCIRRVSKLNPISGFARAMPGLGDL